MNTKTTIELNGQRYDAATGRLMPSSLPGRRLPGRPRQVITSVNMDGFFRNQPTKTTSAPPRQRPAAAASTQAKRRPQKARTLMRHIVQKPTHQAPAAPAARRQRSRYVAGQRHDTNLTSPAGRSLGITKSPFVQRFARHTNGFNRQSTPLAAQAAPIEQSQPAIIAKEAPAVFIEPPRPPLPTTRPRPRAKHHAQDKFSSALQAANSHQAKPLPQKHFSHRAARRLGVSTKLLSWSSASLATILLVGFIAYQNVPNFAMRIAASRAGFRAAMPSYQPAGFRLDGPIRSSHRLITVNFRSNSDNRSFALRQRPTRWDSDSLLTNYILKRDDPYQTYQDSGKTIYIYADSSATWIQNGVWYQVDGRSALSSDQLIRIANSI